MQEPASHVCSVIDANSESDEAQDISVKENKRLTAKTQLYVSYKHEKENARVAGIVSGDIGKTVLLFF